MNEHRLEDPFNENRHRFKVSEIFIISLVVMAFTFHIFSYTIGAWAHLLLCCVFLIGEAFSVKAECITKSTLFLPLAWIIAMIYINAVSLLSDRSKGVVYDIYMLLLLSLFLLFSSGRIVNYRRGPTVIVAVSMIIAASVFLEYFTPSLYKTVVNLFPEGLSKAFLQDNFAFKYYKGFTINSGFAAGYLSVGIAALYAGNFFRKHKRWSTTVVYALLLLSLILTGKRASILFVIISIVVTAYVIQKGKKRRKVLVVAFASGILLIVTYFLFRDLLYGIPIMRRAISTIDGLILGEDISSGRTALYLWALKLFKDNPIFGIGWGMYRTTVVGNVTLVTSLDTHNIYLQVLAETGIVGFLLMMIPLAYAWLQTKTECKWVMSNNRIPTFWRGLVLFSYIYQTYFLLYGLTGNPLYDQFFQIILFFSYMVLKASRITRRKRRHTDISVPTPL